MLLRWQPGWQVEHRRDGEVIWSDWVGQNMFHDLGEQFVCQVVFTEAQTPPSDYYIGVDYRGGTSNEADTLASLVSEPVASSNYFRQPVASASTNWLVSQDAGTGDYEAASSQVTFGPAAGGPWAPMDTVFLTTSSNGTGVLLATVAMSTPRTLQNNDTLTASLTVRIGE